MGVVGNGRPGTTESHEVKCGKHTSPHKEATTSCLALHCFCKQTIYNVLITELMRLVVCSNAAVSRVCVDKLKDTEEKSQFFDLTQYSVKAVVADYYVLLQGMFCCCLCVC